MSDNGNSKTPPSSSQSPPQKSQAPPPSSSKSSPPPKNSNTDSPPRNNPPPPTKKSNNNNNNDGTKNDHTSSGGNSQWLSPPPPRSSSKSSPSSDSSIAFVPPSGTSSKTPSSSSSKSSSGGSTASIPLIAAIAAGAGLLLVIALICCLACCCCRRKKKHYNGNGTYYANTASPMPYPQHAHWQNPQVHGGGPGQYYNSPHNQLYMQQNEILPPPPPPPFAGHPTPPHHGGPTSGDMNYSGYSGPQGPLGPPPPPPPVMPAVLNQSSFTYEELAAATDGFSRANLLGQGGFGYVYKGKLPNGKEVAVKTLKSGSGQGDREFTAEVEIISRVHHRHLVSLVGYCIANEQRILVYEFLPNNTLEFHLHGKGNPTMDWPTRLKIALGSAKGLAYLHEDCHHRIIHRDIKSANILLDFSFEAKVADFGLAKLTTDNNTHVSTRVMGTFGYLAPEYASSGKLTDKSDVFSFGVVLLELITGRRPIDATGAMEDSLVDWARPLCMRALEDGNYDELADPYLERNYPVHEMARMVASAAASIRHSAKRRPKMSQIVRALEGDASLDDLQHGMKPQASGVGSASSRSSEYDSSYSDDLKKFRKTAGIDQSGEFNNSSEYGATSDHGPDSSDYGIGNRGQIPPVKPFQK